MTGEQQQPQEQQQPPVNQTLLKHQPRQLFFAASACLLLVATAVQLRHQTFWPAKASSTRDDAAAQQPPPKQLTYPIWWHAPFYTGSGTCAGSCSMLSRHHHLLIPTTRNTTHQTTPAVTGYGTEAISFVSALAGHLRLADVWISHSGDHIFQVCAQRASGVFWLFSPTCALVHETRLSRVWSYQLPVFVCLPLLPAACTRQP